MPMSFSYILGFFVFSTFILLSVSSTRSSTIMRLKSGLFLMTFALTVQVFRMMSDASEMLAAALEQMDGIIAGILLFSNLTVQK